MILEYTVLLKVSLGALYLLVKVFPAVLNTDIVSDIAIQSFLQLSNSFHTIIIIGTKEGKERKSIEN